MQEINITNSLTRKKEKFVPLDTSRVGIYTCGPTVYDNATIGNFRTYTLGDIVVRTLRFNGYEVKYVMNLTDVGHLTGDNEGDADTGEDRMEKAVRREDTSAWDIAKMYSEGFIKDMNKLNFIEPDNLPKATEHIQEQIELVKELEKKGVTYKISDGIYFDTKKYEEVTGNKYGELSTLDNIKEGARVKVNQEKRNPTDFALWKFSENPGDRHMEWESPWGLGFPGWHIECSAMSMKYLGNSFDIHVGGEDLRQTHHPNEIAQSETATGEQFVKYWIHVTFLQVDGEKMGKSKGNAYNLNDVIEKGYDPLSLRYLYLTAHYRDTLNFTWKALQSAETSLMNLRKKIEFFRGQTRRTVLSEEKRKKAAQYSERFISAINDDFNTPQALAVMWEAIKSNIPSEDKYDLIMTFDEVLGLNLSQVTISKKENVAMKELDKVVITTDELPEEIISKLESREKVRMNDEYEKADQIRKEIEEMGYLIKDTDKGPEIKRIK